MTASPSGAPARGDMIALYRLYDDDDVLLYVGISGDPRLRIAQHKQRLWGAEIRSWSLEWFAERDAAEQAEKAAIHSESPRYNTAETPRHAANVARGLARSPLEAARKARLVQGRRNARSVRFSEAECDSVTERANRADVDFSHMLRRMIAYAGMHMPDGWLPSGTVETRRAS